MTPELNFQYLHSARIGYGYHGICTHEAFNQLGIDVYDGLPGSRDEGLEGKREKICTDILFLTVPTHIGGWWKGQRAHLFTMFETDTLPIGLRDVLHHFETIITPSEVCGDMYRRYHENVHVVDLGVDSDRWHFQPRRKNDVFFNYMISGSGLRKGVDLVHKAFLELFGDGAPGDGPIPRLIIKGQKSAAYEGPGVTVISGEMTPEDEVSLYASAHCYVQPSRGEGWGMQPMQALAQGCPTILTNAHGHAAFAEYGIPLNWTKVPADYGSTMNGPSGDWWEPDYDELVDRMLWVYENYDAACEVAERNSFEVARKFTWQRSAEMVIEAIGGTESLTERLPAAPTEWHELSRKRFRVVTTRNWRADIAGIVYVFHAGKEYWESADIKRILFEAGVLDTTCNDLTDGLTPEEIEQFQKQTAAIDTCPTCGHEISPLFAQQLREEAEEAESIGAA